MAKKIKRKAGRILTPKEINKRYPGSGTVKEIAIPKEDSLWLPSRIIPLNYMLGGGIPYGKILEIFGEESTGKSLVATDFTYACQALKGSVLWGDAEMAYDPYWQNQNGIDSDKVILYPENSIELISDWAADMIITERAKLVNNEPILLVIDSTAALDCQTNIEESQVDARAEMGNRAKAIYKFLRIRNPLFMKYGVCVIMVNQLRKKVGASQWEDPDTTPGGAALRFYAAQRIGLVRSKQIKAKVDGLEMKVGQNIIIKTKKNKVAPPRPDFRSQVYFHNVNGYVGFNNYYGLPDILEGLKIVKNKRSRYYRKDKMLANGEEAFLKLLYENTELRKKLLNKAKVNTINKTREKIQNIKKNNWPVKLKFKNQDENI